MTDYISREEAEKRLFQRAEIANSAYIDQNPYQIMMLAQNVVHLIPAADVRPVVRGRWIRCRFSENIYGFKCEVCHTTWDCDSNFCPNCGAEMWPTAEELTQGHLHL